MATDCIGRTVVAGDFVYSNNYIYEVKAAVDSKSGHGYLKLFLANPSKTTKPKQQPSRECCLLPKEDYLIWLLKK